tara:strand:- start:89 stop:412 length:324 start_codon:yes stop_codon:yes gene_type:complete
MMIKSIRKNLFLFVIVFSVIFTVLPSCSTLNNSSKSSSSSFTKAKYLTDLTYITRDKDLVQRYKEAYISGQTNRPEFIVLNEWSYDRDKEVILETIELFLELEFVGQ